MYEKILIPVDLRHEEALVKSMKVAADLTKLYGGEAHLVGVTQSGPTEVARNPKEFAAKLASFAADQSNALGCNFRAHTEISHDPTVDLDRMLMDAAESIGADLVVMASHVPGLAEHVFASNAGYLASHAKMSVLVVR